MRNRIQLRNLGIRSKRNSAQENRFEYQQLESRNLLATIVANYGNDFPAAGETKVSGWDYQWNAPAAGDVGSGAIDDQAAEFRSLLPVASGSNWTPDGDLNPRTGLGSSYLKLSAAGGHPGAGSANLAGNVDRYAIASYTISQSGVYAIEDSFISLYPGAVLAQTNGLEVRLFVNSNQPIDTVEVKQNSRAFFDSSLGFLSQGDTVHVAVGAKGDLSFDYFEMDFSLVRQSELEHVVASYRSDFNSQAQSNGWQYLWNAPQGWIAGESPGSWFSSPIGSSENYRPLISAGQQWTSDGDLDGLNSDPDYFLRLNATGGFVGNGYQSPFLNDRFAIASYTVENSGQYGIASSFVSVSGNSNDGIEVYVHAGDEFNQSKFVGAGRIGSFDSDLGYLEKGETIYVAFGANGNHAHDRFDMDYRIVRALPRTAPDLSVLDQPLESISVNAPRFGEAGAIPNDNQNDWRAITNAINAAGDGYKEITFQPGIYNVSSIGLEEAKPIFSIWRKQNLVFNGNGSTLIIGEHARELFHTGASSNIVFKNFVIDYAQRVPASQTETQDLYRPLTFTQGKIIQIDPLENSFTIRVNLDAFLAPDPSFTTANSVGWGYAINSTINGRLKTDSPWHYATRWVQPERQPNEFKIFSYQTDGLEVGDKYVLQRRFNNAPVFGVYNDSDNVSLLDVTAYSSPSVFVISINSDSINVIDSQVSIRPDDWPQTNHTQRWKSINADGVHAQANRVGPWVENSTFEGLSDDVMNFYSLPLTILEQLDSRRLVLASLNYEQVESVTGSAMRVGDRLTFFDPVSGSVMEEAKVVSMHSELRADPANSQRKINARVVVLDQHISPITPGTPNDSAKYRNDTIVYNRDSSQGSMVQGNVMAESRRYGNLLLADNSQLVDNVYKGLGDSAISIHNEFEWPLGAFVSNVLVQGNQFLSNGTSSRYLGSNFHTGTISVKAGMYGTDNSLGAGSNRLVNSDEQLFSNLRILDNTFRDWNKTAISIRNSESVLIHGNTILKPSLQKFDGLSLDMHFSKNVSFKSNRVI